MSSFIRKDKNPKYITHFYNNKCDKCNSSRLILNTKGIYVLICKACGNKILVDKK